MKNDFRDFLFVKACDEKKSGEKMNRLFRLPEGESCKSQNDSLTSICIGNHTTIHIGICNEVYTLVYAQKDTHNHTHWHMHRNIHIGKHTTIYIGVYTECLPTLTHLYALKHTHWYTHLKSQKHEVYLT